ncbi:MAG: BatD family protein [Candidatus Omnitrophota bacterium]|nr:MAG: BatD family protein [Candidatus Omnitrophota bacterium]
MSKLSKIVHCYIFIFCFAIFLWGFGENAKKIEARVDKQAVETGEVFIYSLKIEGDFAGSKLTLPKFEGLKIASQQQSKNYSLETDTVKLTLNLIYHLFAPQPGMFTIEPAVIERDGREYKSKRFTIEVSGRPLEEKKKILPYIQGGTDL